MKPRRPYSKVCQPNAASINFSPAGQHRHHYHSGKWNVEMKMLNLCSGCVQISEALWRGEMQLGSVPQWTRVLVSLLALFQLLLSSCWASIWWLSSFPPSFYSPCTILTRLYLSLLYLHLPLSLPQMYCQLQGTQRRTQSCTAICILKPLLLFVTSTFPAQSRSYMYNLTSCAGHLSISLLSSDTGMSHLPES